MGGENEVKRTPIFLLTVALLMLVMSLAALLLAIGTYMMQKTIDLVNIVLSSSAIALSLYLLIQIRKRPKRLDFETSKVTTVIRCVNCDYNSTREFEKGDYILKEVGVCPKCSGSLLIHSIFREVKEKSSK